MKEEVSFGSEHSCVSRSFMRPSPSPPSLSLAKIRHYLRRGATYRPVDRMEYRMTGLENARVSSGGEQRVTRGSILYRGRGPPLVTAMFSPMHDRCHSLRMAVAATPKPSGDTPRTSWGPYRALPLRPPSYPRLVACLRE